MDLNFKSTQKCPKNIEKHAKSDWTPSWDHLEHFWSKLRKKVSFQDFRPRVTQKWSNLPLVGQSAPNVT